jgi:hypothetical protein
MTKNFGQQYDDDLVKMSAASRRKRRLVSVAFDLFFPTAIVAVALGIGNFFFTI